MSDMTSGDLSKPPEETLPASGDLGRAGEAADRKRVPLRRDGAYDAIVNQRVAGLREQRFAGARPSRNS
jgi:hypothetical protein